MATQATSPAPETLDIYDPKNPNFVNPNDVLAQHPNDSAAQVASTRIDVVQATVLRSVQLQIVILNNNLKTIYQTAFNNWLAGWTSLRITDKSTAPEPPNAYVVGYFTPENSAPGALQWAYPETGKDPVCPQPEIPVVDDSPKAKNYIHILGHLSGEWWACGTDDTCPADFETPPGVKTADGATGTFQKYTSPFGGWWRKVGD